MYHYHVVCTNKKNVQKKKTHKRMKFRDPIREKLDFFPLEKGKMVNHSVNLKINSKWNEK